MISETKTKLKMNPEEPISTRSTLHAIRYLKPLLFLGVFFIAGFILFGSAPDAQALTCTASTAGGNWNTTGTWSCGRVPTTADDVVISHNNNMTVTLDTTGVAQSLLVRNTDTAGGGNTVLLAMGTNTLTVSGLTTITGGTGSTNKQASITISTGTLKAQGGITYTVSDGNTNLTTTGAANIELTGNWDSGNDGSINSATTVKGVGTSAINGAYALGNLQTVSGTMTTGAALTVAGTLTIDASSQLSVAGFNFSVTGATSVSGTLALTSSTGTKTFSGAVTVNSGGSWTNTANASITFNNDFTNNSGGTLSMGTGQHTLAAGNISGSSSITFGGTVSIDPFANPTNNNSGTVSIATLTLSDTSAGWTQGTNSYLKITNQVNGTGVLAASATGNTVEYSASGTQTIFTPASSTYYHLILSGTSAKTAGGGLTVNGDFTIGGSATFAGGTSLTHTFLGNWVLDTSAASSPYTFTTAGTINFNTPGTPAATTIGGTTTQTTAFNIVNFNNTSGTTLNDNASFSGAVAIATNVTLTTGANATSVAPASTFTVTGTFTPNAATVISGAGTLTGGGTAKVSLNAANAFLTQYTITNKTLTNLTVEYLGGASQLISDATYGSSGSGGLKVSGTINASGTQDASVGGVFTVTGTFTPSAGIIGFGSGSSIVNSGTLTFYNISHLGAGAVTTASSFNIAHAFSTSGGAATSFTASAGTITFNTTGSNFDNGGVPTTTVTFNNLTIANSVSFTTAQDFTVAGTLTVGSSASLVASAGVITVNGGGSISNSGTLTFYNLTTSCSSTSVTANTSFTVSVTFTNGSTCTMSPSSGTYTFNDDFTNNGTFTASGTHTTVLATTATAVITGASTFNNFSVTGIGAAKTIQFEAGVVFSFAGAANSVTVTGTAGNLITITSTTTAVWLADFTNTQNTLTYIFLQHSGCSTSAVVTMDATSTNDATATINDSTCWSFPAAAVVISGATDMGAESNVIKVAINGAVDTAAGSIAANNTWSITPDVAPTNGQTVVVFITGHADSTESTAVEKYDGTGDMTGLVLNTNVLSIGSTVDNQSLTVADLDTAGDCNLDENIMFSSSTTALDVDGSCNTYTNPTIQIESGDTLTIDSDETLTTDNLTITGTLVQTTAGVITAIGNISSGGTFTGGSGAISAVDLSITAGTFTSTSGTMSLSGNYSNSGTFTNNSGTVTFTATDTGNTIGGTLSGTSDFSKIIFNGSGGEWTLGANLETDGASVTASDVQAGTLKNGGFSITGNGATDTFSVGNGAFFEMSGTSAYPASFTTYTYGATSTVTYRQTNATVITNATYGHLNLMPGNATALVLPVTLTNIPGNLTIGDGTNAGAEASTNNPSFSVAGVMTIAANATYATGTGTLTLSNTGTPLVKTGTLTSTAGGTINYTGNGATITAADYATLGLKPSSSTPQILGSGTYNITNLNVGDATNAGAEGTTNNPTLNVSGTMTVAAGATFTPHASGVINSGGAGTSTLTGAGTVKVSRDALNAFATQYVFNTRTLTNLTVDYTGGATQYLSQFDYSNLTVSGSITSGANNNPTVSGTFNVTGTFTPTSGTITMNNGSSIVNSGTLTFQNLTTAASATVTTASSFGFVGTLTNGTTASFTASAGTITSTAGTISNDGTTLSFSGLTIGTGTTTANTSYTVSGVLTVTGTLSPTSGTITLSGSGTPLSIGGTFSPSGTNTVTYSNAGATITNTTFNNLTISAAITASTTATVSGILTTSAAFAPTAGTITLNNGSSIVTSGSAPTFFNLTTAASATVTTSSNFSFIGTLTNGTTASFTASTPSVITSTAGTISNGGTTLAFYDLTIGTGTTTANTSYTVSNVLTVSGTLSPTSGTITLSGAGTPLSIAGTFSPSGTNTVTYSNAGATITNTTFNNLTISAAITASTTTTVGGALTTSAAFAPTAGTITLNNGSSIVTSGSAPTFFNLTTAASATVTTASNFSVAGTLTNGTTASFTASTPSVITMNNSSVISNGGTLLSFYDLTIANAATVTANTSYTVSNLLTVGTSAVLAPTSGTITLNNDLTNNGTFTASGTNTVALATTATATITGASTFNNFTVTGIGAAKTIQFEAGVVFSFAGAANSFVVTGTAGNLITITSTTTAVWLADFTNTQNTATYVFLQHSGCSTSAIVTMDATSTNDPTATINDSACWQFPPPSITISGTTNAGDGITVAVAVNGTIAGQTGTTATSAWSIANVTVGSGQIVTVFFDAQADSAESTAVAKYDGSGDMTGMVLNTNVLSIGSTVDDGALTVADLDTSGTGYECTDDEDVMYDATTTALNVDGSCNTYTDPTIQIESGDTLTIDSDETLTTDNLTITGTLTQTTTGVITVTGNLASAGTFNGGSGAISITGNYTLTAGTFTSTTGTLKIGGNFTHTVGGTFTHNSGTVLAEHTGSGLSVTWNVSTTETFNILTINLVNGGSGNIFTVSSGDTLVVLGTLTVTDGQINTGTIEARAGVTVGAGGDARGSGTVSFLVAGDQVITTSGGFLPSININKPSGTVSVSGTNLGITAFTLAGSGAFTAPTGTFWIRGSFTHTAGGTFSHNNSSIVAGTTVECDGNVTWDVTTTETINNLTVNTATGGCGNTFTIATGDTLVVAGNFVQTDGSMSTGTLEVRGNVTINSGADGGSSPINLTGSTAQTWTDNGGNEPDGDITINKTNNSDTVTLATNADWNASSQDINITKGVLDLATFTATTAATATIGANGTLTGSTGTLTMTSTGTPFTNSGAITGGTVKYTGNGATVRSTTYQNLQLMPSSTSAQTLMAGTLTVNGNLTVGNGTNAGANASTNNATVNVVGDMTIAAGAVYTASGTNPITITGNFSNSGDIIHSSGVFIFNATDAGNTLSGGLAFQNGHWQFYDVTFDGINGEWSESGATGNFEIQHNLTINNGTLSGTKTIVMGPGTVTGAGTLNLTGRIRFSGTTAVSNTGNWTVDYFTPGDGSGTDTITASGAGSITVNIAMAIEIGAILNAGPKTYILTATGTPLTNSGTFNADTSTIRYTGDGATITNVSYNHLELKPSSTAQQVLPAGTLTIGGNLTVGDGTNQGATAATNNPVMNVTGTATIAAGATFTTGTSTWTQTGNLTVTGTLSGTANGSIVAGADVTGTGTVNLTTAGTFEQKFTSNQNFGATSGTNDWTFYNLTFNSISPTIVRTITTQTGGSGSITVSNTMTLKKDSGLVADMILDAGNRTWILPATGTPLVIDASQTLTANTSTFNYTYVTGGGSITVAAATYYNLGVGTTSDANAASTFALAAATVVNNALTIGNATSTNSDVFSTSASNYSLTASSINITSKGTLTANNSTVTLTGSGTPFTNSGTFNIDTSTVVYNHGTSANVTATTYNNLTLGGTGTYTLPGSTLTLRGNLSIPSGSTVTKGAGTMLFARTGAGTSTWTDSTAGTQDIGAVQVSNGGGVTTLSTSSNAKATSITVDTSQNLDISSDTLILTGTSTPLTLAGSNTFTITGSTVQYTGTTATVTGTSFNHLTLGGTGTYTLPDADVNVKGNFVITNNATVTKSSANKVVFNGDTTQTWTDNTATPQDLGIIQISTAGGGGTTVSTGSDVKATTLTVDSSQTFEFGGNDILTITGNSTPISNSGSFDAGTGTVEFASAATTGTTVPILNYYNLKVNKAANNFTVPAGTLAVSNNLDVTAGTLDLNTSDPTVTVTGTLTIGGTLSASSVTANPLTISGDFTNNGTFTHNSGKVIVTPSNTSVIGGSANTDFYDFSSTTGGKTLQFKAGNEFGFAGAMVMTGSPGNRLTVHSDTPTSRWFVDLTGTATVSFVRLKDAGCVGGSNSIVTHASVINQGNNDTTCWIFIVRGAGAGASEGGSGSSGASGGGGSGGGGGGSQGGGGGTSDLPEPFTAGDGTNLTTYSSFWTVLAGAFAINTNSVYANDASNSLAKWNATTFGNDQFAQMTVTALDASGSIGVAVRVQPAAASGYAVLINSGSASIWEFANGTPTSICTDCATFNAGDLVRLQIIGSTITLRKNGSVVATVTDGTYTSGAPGIGGTSNNVNNRGDNWTAGSISGGGGGGGSP